MPRAARFTRSEPPVTILKGARSTRADIDYREAGNYAKRPRRHPRARPLHLDPWYPKRKQNPNPKPRPCRASPSHFTCRICIEYQTADNFIPWVPPKRFSNYPIPRIPRTCVPHLAQNPAQRGVDPVCKTCIGAHMAARLETHGARAVCEACIEPGCKRPWGSDEVLRLFPAASIEKYNIAMLEVWKMDVAGSRLVTCISESCGAIGLADPYAPGFPDVACATCTKRMCASCRVEDHGGLTCSEFQAKAVDAEMTEEEKETLRLLQEKDGKRCPGCHIVIEKDGGCNHMQCGNCRTNFNWGTAASAVLGSKRALTEQQAQNGVGVDLRVCEMDELMKKEKLDAGMRDSPMEGLVVG